MCLLAVGVELTTPPLSQLNWEEAGKGSLRRNRKVERGGRPSSVMHSNFLPSVLFKLQLVGGPTHFDI